MAIRQLNVKRVHQKMHWLLRIMLLIFNLKLIAVFSFHVSLLTVPMVVAYYQCVVVMVVGVDTWQQSY